MGALKLKRFSVCVLIIVFAMTLCLGDDTQCLPQDHLAGLHTCQRCCAFPVRDSHDRFCHVSWKTWPSTHPPHRTSVRHSVCRCSGANLVARPGRSWLALSGIASSNSKSTIRITRGKVDFGHSLDRSMETIALLAVVVRRLGPNIWMKMLLVFCPNVILSWCVAYSECKYNRGKLLHSLFPVNCWPNWFKSVWDNRYFNNSKEIPQKNVFYRRKYEKEEVCDPLYNLLPPVRRPMEAFMVQALSMPRLASYQRFPQDQLASSVSFLLLAQAGFKYSGEGTRVTCEGCSSTLDICEVSENPSSQEHHREGCPFSLVSDRSHENLTQTSRLTGGGHAPRTLPAAAEVLGASVSSASSTPVTPPDNKVGSSQASGATAKPPTDQRSEYQVHSWTGQTSSSPGPPVQTSNLKVTEQSVSATLQHRREQATSSSRPEHMETIAEIRGLIDRPDLLAPGCAQSLETSVGWESNKSSTESTAPAAATQRDGSQNPTRENYEENSVSGSHVGAVNSHNPVFSDVNSSVFVSGSRYLEDASLTARYFYGTELFEAELCHEREKPDRVKHVEIGACEKNPGHFCYWSPAELSEETLPERMRCPQLVRFLSLAAELTVRVVVGYTSTATARGSTQGDRFRIGTGSVIREPLFNSITGDAQVECDAVPSSSLAGRPRATRCSNRFARTLAKASVKAMRKYAPGMKRRKSMIYVETNRHVVFDNEEAIHTTVEFYLDHHDQRIVQSLKVSRVMHDATLDGGSRSLLVCDTSDLNFVHQLRVKRLELANLARQFPSGAREALLKHVFVIHHPHGGEKLFSFGTSLVRKYKLEPTSFSVPSEDTMSFDHAPQKRLTKIVDINQMPRDGSAVRKLLVYTADTCRGSSGAPVIAFTCDTTQTRDAPNFAFSLWMHEGKEINGPLNVSAMEACSAADLIPARPQPLPPAPASVPAPAPLVRMHNPTYYVYSSLRKRLESFARIPPETFVHSIIDMANGGFFYAGYSDCVRCFYCGVGIKQWHPNDDLYLEHARRRPDCHFLILQLRAMGATRPALTSSALSTQNASRSAAPILQTMTTPVNFLSSSPTCSSVEPPVSFDQNTLGESAGAGCGGASRSFFPWQPPQEVVAYPITEYTFTHPSNNFHQSSKAEANNKSSDPAMGAMAHSGDPDCQQSVEVALLQTENAILERPLTCKVCKAAPVGEIYLPCGHLDSCSACTESLDNCPTCLRQVRATVKIYFA